MEAQQPQFHAIHLHVTEGAQTEMFGEIPLLYVGISYHIPREKLEEAQQIFESTQDALEAQRVIMNVDISPDVLLQQVMERGFSPVPEAVLERFDTVDSETGDLLVLLRVPCSMGEMGGPV